MKKFNFSLEKILSLKKYVEEQRKEAFSKIVSECNKIDQTILANIKKSQIKLSDFSCENQDINNIIYTLSLYRERLSQENELLIKKKTELEEKKLEALNLFLDSQRDRKVLENLREKRFYEHKKDIMSEEMQQIDEISSQQYIRNSGG